MIQLWAPDDHDGLDAVEILLRGDPDAVKAKTAMGDAKFAKAEKESPSAIMAVRREAYAVLNSMFTDGSPAHTFIMSTAKSGAVPRGDGIALYAALLAHFNSGVAKPLNVVHLIDELKSLKCGDEESAVDFVVRFEALNAQLLQKDPPVRLDDAILMPLLTDGLTDDYSVVKRKQKRGQYGLDMKKLVEAIHEERDIIRAGGPSENGEHGPSRGLAADARAEEDEKAADAKRAKRKAKKARRKAKLAERLQAAEQALAAAGHATSKSGKGKGAKGGGLHTPPAHRQCHTCGQFGHISSQCPAKTQSMTPPQHGMIWCNFHHAWGWHLEAQCRRNPANFQGYGRGMNYPSGYGSSYDAKGKGGGRGKGHHGKGFVADIDNTNFPDIDTDLTSY